MKNVYTKSTTLIIFSLLIIVFILPSKLFPQSTWNKLTSFGSTTSIIDLEMGQGGTIYVLSVDRWIYTSSDHGETWIAFTEVPAFYNTQRIKSSKVSNRVFTSTSLSGIAYTDNQGVNWSIDPISTNSNGFGLSVTDYAINGNSVMVLAGGGLFLSNSNGSAGTYINVNDSISSITNSSFVNNLDYFSNSLVLLSTDNGLYKSQNNGATFSSMSIFSGKQVKKLMRTDGGILYAAVNDSSNMSSSGRLYHSLDSGVTWTVFNSLPLEHINSIAYDEFNDIIYVATSDQGIYKSTDNGNTWLNVNTNANLGNIMIASDTTLIGTGREEIGVLKAFSSIPLILARKTVGLIPVVTTMGIAGNNKIYTGSAYNQFISVYDLNAPSWSPEDLRDVFGLENEFVYTTQIDISTTGDLVLSGSNYIGLVDSSSGAISLIVDSSTTGLPTHNFTGLLDPRLTTSGNNGEIMMSPGFQTELFVTLDQGINWDTLITPAQTGLPFFMRFEGAEKGRNTYYVLASSVTLESTVIKSNDMGATWTPISNNFPTHHTDQIFVDNYNTLYRRTQTSLYRHDSINNSWVLLNLNLGINPNIHFELKFDHNNRIYALFYLSQGSSSDQGVYYSDDQGSTWNFTGFPTFLGSEVLLEDLWFDRNNTPIGRTIRSQNSYDENRDGIYQFSNVNGINENKSDRQIIQIYPNPSTGRINIPFEEKLSELEYTIYNSTGRVVVRGDLANIDKEITIDLKGIAKGLYFVRITTPEWESTSKVMVTK